MTEGLVSVISDYTAEKGSLCYRFNHPQQLQNLNKAHSRCAM